MERTLAADYVVMGAGATGMAFTDAVLDGSDASVVLVDRRDRPGGHWNDAYPYVRLHQPSSTYGVSSLPLGTGRIDELGLNAGFHELASGQEVLGHYDQVLRERFLGSGRVTFLPMCELDDGGVATSLLSGERCRIDARRFVDATHSRMRIPSTTPPSFDVAAGVRCVPPNDLPRVAAAHDRFVVVGAGKTGMDACIWLLSNGAAPAQLTWIVPNDSWVLDRANVQPGAAAFARFAKSLADQVEAVSGASSIGDLFERLEAFGELRRIDPDVQPGAYHCAILSDGEIEALRQIDQVVRLGRVTAIGAGEVQLEQGTLRVPEGALYVDCTAAGIPTHPSKPVFDGDRITLQWVRTCQPTYSAAMIGFVECTYDDEVLKGEICQPIVPPTVPVDWLRMMQVELANRVCWARHPEIAEWQASTRLDPFQAVARERLGVDPEAAAHLGRYLDHLEPARERLAELLG